MWLRAVLFWRGKRGPSWLLSLLLNRSNSSDHPPYFLHKHKYFFKILMENKIINFKKLKYILQTSFILTHPGCYREHFVTKDKFAVD